MERDEAREVCRGQIGKGLVVLGSGSLDLLLKAEESFEGFPPPHPTPRPKQSSDIDFNLRDKNFDLLLFL